MYFPSQPVTSMRLIGFKDNFFTGPEAGDRNGLRAQDRNREEMTMSDHL